MAGLFQHIGGNAANRDRAEQLNAYGDLRNVFNWALPFGQSQARTGQATTAAGVGALGDAGNYFRKLASGDRTTALQAVAPQTNAALAQSDTEKRQLSNMGTARGGGTIGVNQQRDSDLMAKIDNMLFGARTAGAQGEAGVGQSMAGVGLGQTGQGIESAGLATGTAAALGRQALAGRQQSNEMHRQAVSDITSAVEDIISGAMSGGGFGGFMESV